MLPLREERAKRCKEQETAEMTDIEGNHGAPSAAKMRLNCTMHREEGRRYLTSPLRRHLCAHSLLTTATAAVR